MIPNELEKARDKTIEKLAAVENTKRFNLKKALLTAAEIEEMKNDIASIMKAASKPTARITNPASAGPSIRASWLVVDVNDDALTKMLYLAYAYRDISKKWTMSIRDWAFIFSQLSIIFEERLKPFIK